MTRSAHQPSNQPGLAGGRRGEERRRRERAERRKKEEREREGADESVLPSNTLALMAPTALTFNH